ncbi:MAG TPA: hypothetical protein VFN49_11020 [Candidatus Aquilonibacter sp.]|nr:hypothetical protein [Candidatus Aquilonibacter sp.]
MPKTLIRAAAAILIAASFGMSAVPATADVGQAMANSVVNGANTAIRNVMDQPAPKAQTKQKDSLQPGAVAQVPPVQQAPVSAGQQAQGLPTGFTYFADVSAAYPFGNIGRTAATNNSRWLQGGFDAMGAYGFNPTQRLVASYYELQHYPVGFNTGTHPLYLPPGFPPSPGVNPAPTDISNLNLDLTTKDRFLLLSFEQLMTVGTMKHRPIPLVVTPTYVSRWSTVAASPYGNSDVVPFVDQNGTPHFDIHTRTAQYDSIAFTAPFLKTPKMFGTFTVAPTILTHLNGVNQQNAIQLYQILYLEYNYNKDLRFFFEPQSSRDYLPTDPYAQHLFAYFLGATQRFGKVGFVQLVLNSGGPTNYKPYGINYLQCYALPCSTNTVPAVGGLKATQLQFEVGVGSPVVLPF